MTDHKDYLDEQYRLAAQDYRMARNEDEQWSARRRMQSFTGQMIFPLESILPIFA